MRCPHCNSPVSVTDRAGNPRYACGTTKTFRSASCVDREPLAAELRNALAHIKRLEEALEECDWAFTKFCPEHESRYGDAWEKVRDALNRPNPFKPYWPEDNP